MVPGPRSIGPAKYSIEPDVGMLDGMTAAERVTRSP
jgi:hypothetical protein